MKQRILILTDPIGKPAYAPRLRYFADYLMRHGLEVEVYSEQFEPHHFEHTYPIIELPAYKGSLDWAIKSVWSLLTDWRNRHFSKQLRKALVSKHFDIVLCTTFSTFPLRAALDVAHERHIPLLVDIRDLDEQVPDAQYQAHRQWWTKPFRKWYSAVNIQRRNRVLKQANAITTISPWHVDFIRNIIGDTTAKHVHLIYNGYNPSLFYPSDIHTDTFTISYIGRIYEFQSTQLIEQAVQELHIPEIRLSWHTPKSNNLDISEVGDAIRLSSILLVLTNPNAKGMMTTKFYEALGCEKPILCIPSDNGILAETIRKTNAGLASSDIEEIKQFILEKYREWKQQGFTRQPVCQKEQFSRENESADLLSIIQTTIHQHDEQAANFPLRSLHKILLVGDGFGAPAYSPRLRLLCKYLFEHGYDIDVIVDYIQPLPFAHDYPIHEINYYRGKGIFGKIDWAIKNILSIFFDSKNRYAYHQIERICQGKTYDLVFCTTFYTYPLGAAERYALKHKTPIVMDLRDVIEQAPNNQINYFAHNSSLLRAFIRPYQHINRIRRNRVLRHADAITTVSPWHQQLLSHYNDNVHLIYNGYDDTLFIPKQEPSSKFILSYAGKFFGAPLQDATLLFEALQQLKDIDYEVHIHSHTKGQRQLRQFARQYGIESHFVFADYIPQREVVALYHQSSIILIFTNRASDTTVHGLMTTKFFEALGAEKPILCVQSDNECLTDIIHYTNAGLAANTVDEVTAFIRNQYATWQAQGFTHQYVLHKESFTRQYQAQQFIDLFQSTLQPTVSIIVPVYNSESYLEKMLQSLVEQTYPNLDIILVDDASTDNSLAIAQSFAAKDNRIRVFTKSHEGQATARNFGLQYAKGEWVSFVDSDDWLDSNHYATLLNSPKVDIIQFGYRRVNDAGHIIEENIPRYFHRFTTSWMRLYRKSFLEKNYLRFTSGMYYDDIFFSLDVWSCNPSYIIRPYTGYNYRLTPNSITTAPPSDAQHTTMTALRQRLHSAKTIRNKIIVAFTIMRLAAYFRKQH